MNPRLVNSSVHPTGYVDKVVRTFAKLSLQLNSWPL